MYLRSAVKPLRDNDQRSNYAAMARVYIRLSYRVAQRVFPLPRYLIETRKSRLFAHTLWPEYVRRSFVRFLGVFAAEFPSRCVVRERRLTQKDDVNTPRAITYRYL